MGPRHPAAAAALSPVALMAAAAAAALVFFVPDDGFRRYLITARGAVAHASFARVRPVPGDVRTGHRVAFFRATTTHQSGWRRASSAGRGGGFCPIPAPLLGAVPAMLSVLFWICCSSFRAGPPGCEWRVMTTSATNYARVDPCVVIVRGLPRSATWQMLKEHFGTVGTVVYANVSRWNLRGIVRYANEKAVARALRDLPRQQLAGTYLTLHRDEGSAALVQKPKEEARQDYARDPWDVTADGSPSDVAFAAEIQGAVEQRAALKLSGDYDAADALRSRLEHNGVLIDDRTRTWYVERRRPRRAPWTYSRDPSDTTADGSRWDAALAAEVERLLEDRRTLRVRGRYQEADDLHARLMQKRIQVNDGTRRWRRIPPGPPVAEQVIVGNVPPGATWQTLKDHFRAAGEVEYAAIYRSQETGQPTGRAMVKFASVDGARIALATMRQHPLDGVILDVWPDTRPALAGTPPTPQTLALPSQW